MKFNVHSDLSDRHAFLSPSKYHWINYSNERLTDAFKKYLAIQRGTDLHKLASDCIKFGVKLANLKIALNLFVNDAIGYRMSSEQPLYFSENAFGTADAISFRDNVLRIHDLKTGVTPVKMGQLEVYAALFCLEYDEDPEKITIELRIYQGNDVIIYEPNPGDIRDIMNKIVIFDKEIDKLKYQME